MRGLAGIAVFLAACASTTNASPDAVADGDAALATEADVGGCATPAGWCRLGEVCRIPHDCNECRCYAEPDGTVSFDCSTIACPRCEWTDGKGACTQPDFACDDTDGCECHCLTDDGGRGPACKSGECCALGDGTLCRSTVSCTSTNDCACTCDLPDGGTLADGALGPTCTPWQCSPRDAGHD